MRWLHYTGRLCHGTTEKSWTRWKRWTRVGQSPGLRSRDCGRPTAGRSEAMQHAAPLHDECRFVRTEGVTARPPHLHAPPARQPPRHRFEQRCEVEGGVERAESLDERHALAPVPLHAADVALPQRLRDLRLRPRAEVAAVVGEVDEHRHRRFVDVGAPRPSIGT
eukprot:gene9228-biopygen2899